MDSPVILRITIIQACGWVPAIVEMETLVWDNGPVPDKLTGIVDHIISKAITTSLPEILLSCASFADYVPTIPKANSARRERRWGPSE